MASVETIAISVCPSITVIVIAVVRKRRIESLDRGQVCELSAGLRPQQSLRFRLLSLSQCPAPALSVVGPAWAWQVLGWP